MIDKKYFLVCILLISLLNSSNSFYFGNEQEEADFIERRLEQLEIVPRIAESFIIKSVFVTDREDPVSTLSQSDDYNDNLMELENRLEKEQEKFIENYIHFETNTTEPTNLVTETTELSTTETVQNEKYVFTNEKGYIDSSYFFIEFSESLNYTQAEDLIKYISSFTQIPLESFQELR